MTTPSHDYVHHWAELIPTVHTSFLARFSEPGLLWCAVVSQLEKKSDVSHRISLVRATSRFCDETLHWFLITFRATLTCEPREWSIEWSDLSVTIYNGQCRGIC
jgi:hypothetical protein